MCRRLGKFHCRGGCRVWRCGRSAQRLGRNLKTRCRFCGGRCSGRKNGQRAAQRDAICEGEGQRGVSWEKLTWSGEAAEGRWESRIAEGNSEPEGRITCTGFKAWGCLISL